MRMGLGLESAATAAWRVLTTAARIASACPTGGSADTDKTGVFGHAAGACVAINAPCAVAFCDSAKAGWNVFVALDTLTGISV